MNIQAYHRQQKQLADAQSAWDNMSDPRLEEDGVEDDEEGGDEETEDE